MNRSTREEPSVSLVSARPNPSFQLSCLRQAMVLELLRPFGALRFEIDRGLTSPDGSKPPFVAAGHLIVASAERLNQGLAMYGARMAADVNNFTNIVAQLQVSEIISQASTDASYCA